ncbi:MAG TPA: ABC transporter permease, partial [Flavisolibacter sp.]|nr:ABC transporter permease [Flavisolibacter sp.]
MRTLRFLLQKEFRQIFRDPSILRIIFAMPLIQLIVLPWAADYEVKNINLAVADRDLSSYSRQLISKITASGYFHLDAYSQSYLQSLEEISSNKADIILEIPPHFEKDLVKENEANLFMAVNSINGTKAILGSSYLQSIISDFNMGIREKWIQFPRFNPETQIQVTTAK